MKRGLVIGSKTLECSIEHYLLFGHLISQIFPFSQVFSLFLMRWLGPVCLHGPRRPGTTTHTEGPILASKTLAIMFSFPWLLTGSALCILAGFLLHTKALAQIGLFVNEDFSRDNISKRHEHLQDVLVSKLLWKVVNKEVCTLWT